MKRILFIALGTVMIALSSCADIYTAPSFATERRGHKTIAILPFKIAFSAKSFKSGTPQSVIEKEEAEHSRLIQEQVYTHFLRRLSNNRYSIEFQDISKTNALLKKSAISYDSLALKTNDELAQMLGVDVVLSGKVQMAKPMSTGLAVGLWLLTGFGGRTNEVNSVLSIHDTKGALLWHYSHTFSGGFASSVESVSDALMQNVAKKFPYRISTNH
jgi:hypothetical protein